MTYLYMVLINTGQTYDRMHVDIIWYVFEKEGVTKGGILT